jgi:hypothetical protein
MPLALSFPNQQRSSAFTASCFDQLKIFFRRLTWTNQSVFQKAAEAVTFVSIITAAVIWIFVLTNLQIYNL